MNLRRLEDTDLRVPLQPMNPFFPKIVSHNWHHSQTNAKKADLKIHRNNRNKRTGNFLYFHTPG